MSQDKKFTVKARFEIGAAKTWTTAAVDLAADTIRIPNHGFKTADNVGLSSTGAVPTGLTALTTAYYIIPVDASTVAFATSRANAFAGTKVNLTAVGSGVGTMQQGALGITHSEILIPKDHYVVNARYLVHTTAASPTGPDNGTLAISLVAANDIVSAVTIATGTVWDDTNAQVVGIPLINTVSTYLLTTSDVPVVFTTGSDAWTAGKLDVFLDIVPALA